MNETTLIQFAGWSAVINGITSIASTLTLILMFAVAAFFGPLNDAISVIWVLSFIPLALFLHQLHRPINAPLSLISAVAGVGAMLVFAVAQMLLVLRVVRFEQSIGLILVMGAVIGLWAMVNGFLSRSGQTVPATMSWLLIIFGASYIFTAIGWNAAGQQHPLVMIGFLIGAIAGPIWAIWLGRLLLAADVGLRIVE